MSTFRLGGKRKHHLINNSDKFKISSEERKGSDYLKFNNILYEKLDNSLKEHNKINSFNFINNQNNEQLIKNIEEFFKVLNDKNIKLLAFQKEIILNTVLADKRKFEYDELLNKKKESKLIENGTKISIIDNPTGSGKTLCSLISAIIYSLEEEDNIKNNMQKYFTNKSKWYEINENTKYKNVIFISASQNLVPQWEAEAINLKKVLSDFILTKYKKEINVQHSPTCKLFKNFYNENSLLILISKNETSDTHKFLYEKDNLKNINIKEDNLAFPVFIQDESHLYNSQMFNQVSEINYNSKKKKYPAPLASHFIVLSASISNCYDKLFENSLNTTFNYEFNHLNLINKNKYYYLDKNNNIELNNNFERKYYEGINRDFSDSLLNTFIDIKKILPDNEFKYMKILKFFESNILMKNILFLFSNYSDIIDKLLLIFEFKFCKEDNFIKYIYINELIEKCNIESYEYDIFNSNSSNSKKIFNGEFIERRKLLKYFEMNNNLKTINNNNSIDTKELICEQKEKIKSEFSRENSSTLPLWREFWLECSDTNKFYFNINNHKNIDDLIKGLVKVLDDYYKKNYFDKLSSLIKILYLSAHEYNKYFKLALLNSVRCSTDNIISLYKILQDIPITVINMKINSQNDKELLALENPIENFNSWKERINNLYSINIPQEFYNKEISFKDLVDLANIQKNEKINLLNNIKTDIRLKNSDKELQIKSVNQLIKRIDVGIENWSKNEEECQICYNEININKITKLILCTNCQNISCSDCLEKWYKRSKSCPICRGSKKQTLYLNNEISPKEKYEKEIKINNINELGKELCNGSYENKYYINTSILGRLEKVFYYFNKYIDDTNEKLSFLMICRSNDFENVFDSIMSIFRSEKFIFIRYDNKGTLNNSINKRKNYEKEELGKIKILLCYDSENCDTTSGLNFPFIDGIITLGTSSSHEKESQRIGRALRLSRIELKKNDLLLIKIESNIENNNKKSKSTNIDLINTSSSSSSSDDLSTTSSSSLSINNLSTTSSSSSSSNNLSTTLSSSLSTDNLSTTSSSSPNSNVLTSPSSLQRSNYLGGISSSSSSSNVLTSPLFSLQRSNYLGGTSSSSSSSNYLRTTSLDLPEEFLYFDRINGIHNIYKSDNDNDNDLFLF
jgi:hypothetical protein